MPANPVEFISMFSTGFVAFVLLFSGATKLGRAARTLDSMGALGVPAFAQRRWIAAAVPLWEIGLGLALLLTSGWLRAASAALALGTFAVFTVFLIGVLRRGEEVDCGCFGPLSADDRVTGWTVARNVVLIIASTIAAVTAASRPALVVELFTAEATLVLFTALAWTLVALAVVTAALVRLRRPSEDPAASASAAPTIAAGVGDPLPAAELVSGDGVTLPLNVLGAGAPVLLVFLSAECGKCAAVAKRLPEWQEQIGSSVLLRVATSSRPDFLASKYPEAAPFAYYGARAAKNALGIEGIPSAVLLGGLQHPFVASPVAHREDEIDALVRGIVEAQAQASADAAG
ncbi:TlpA family protein disulfide reductase [Microbacterium hydrocarbonoxydans]|uniref:TlpA family protein disulfide reductase n=1 Tax=Microbacterium hydrocarbonoxydans TaxID=273678 RepID=UPI0013DA4829|nr:MauE/DoxX family redox-associated membrane protein [Microbacterium hydrocarbonoxydans]